MNTAQRQGTAIRTQRSVSRAHNFMCGRHLIQSTGHQIAVHQALLNQPPCNWVCPSSMTSSPKYSILRDIYCLSDQLNVSPLIRMDRNFVCRSLIRPKHRFHRFRLDFVSFSRPYPFLLLLYDAASILPSLFEPASDPYWSKGFGYILWKSLWLIVTFWCLCLIWCKIILGRAGLEFVALDRDAPDADVPPRWVQSAYIYWYSVLEMGVGGFVVAWLRGCRKSCNFVVSFTNA